MSTNIDIEQLKKDIEHHESLKVRFIKESNYMIYFVIVLTILSIFGLFMSKFLLSGSFFIFAFLSFRRYNILIGKAEIHTSIMKFLKTLLIQEQTGEDVFKNIVG